MNEINWPKVDKFLSPQEIVEVLYQREKDFEGIKEFVQNDPAMYHHGVGTSIRNEFHLWHPDNPFTMKDYIAEIRDGADCNPKHPDNISGRILEELQQRCAKYFKEKK